MKLEDLKLLIDVAWGERNGQQGIIVERGFDAACERLIKMGLIIKNPNAEIQIVSLTEKAESLIFDTPPKYSAMQAAALERRVKHAKSIAVAVGYGRALQKEPKK